MKTENDLWIEKQPDYWVNANSQYVVREVGKSSQKEWVILDNNGMMLFCEWKTSKKFCMNEADRIFKHDA